MLSIYIKNFYSCTWTVLFPKSPAVNQNQNYMNTGEEILKEETNFGAGEVGERE